VRTGIAVASLVVVFGARATLAAPPSKIDRKAIEAIGVRWWKARPKTRFDDWDAKVRDGLLAEARALGALPEGALDEVRELLWKGVRKHGPSGDEQVPTPYGPATWIQNGRGGKKQGLVVGLHGGGPGAGSAGEAAGAWNFPGCMGMYPQGIRLVHDTWNTVHGERFVLTLLEIAKAQHEIDPDKVYVAGFSMGGTGSWFMAGRHPDLLAGAVPGAGVLMAAPKSQVPTKEEVTSLQHGFVPNVRNLAMSFFIGLEDKNCMPGTFLYVWDRLLEHKAADPDGYRLVQFASYPSLAHSFPPGEPRKSIDFVLAQRRDAFPKKLVWEYAAEPFPQPESEEDRKVGRFVKRDFYWLHCERPTDRSTVTATIADNVVDLSTGGGFAEDFWIWLHPKMIDVTKDVVVRVDGKQAYQGKPVPDVATVLESLDARLDRTLCFDRRVRLDPRQTTPR
jgi:pimeloyl-ACP methyl ester carboxylesterase